MLSLSPPKQPAADPPPGGAPTTAAAAAPRKKFNNGWTREIENLMAEWADKAVCYRWMHEKTERMFARKDMSMAFPVIILSTITGAANFAMDSVLETAEQKKYAQLALGGLSIATGILSTIANRLAYSSGAQAHKNAGVSWGKFQRLIAIELSLHPNERIDCMQFLKMCRTELDSLIEQSPSIPEAIIYACKREFKAYPKVRKPEIVGDIDTTRIFVDTNGRLAQVAKEAALAIHQKKGVLKQIVLDDLEPRIQHVIENSTLPAIKEELKQEVRRAADRATREAIAAGKVASSAPPSIPNAVMNVQQQVQERADEIKKVVTSGHVMAMRKRLMESNTVLGPVNTGLGLQVPLESLNTEDILLHISAGSMQEEMGDGEGENTTDSNAASPHDDGDGNSEANHHGVAEDALALDIKI